MTFNVKMDDTKISVDVFKTKINDVLQYCKPKEQLVLVKKFGLSSSKWIPLQQIGKEYNLTRERVRQIESQALMRFRRLMVNNVRYTNFINRAKDILNDFGWLLTEEDLVKELINTNEFEFDAKEMTLILISDFDITHLKRNRFLDKCFYLDNLFEDLLTQMAIYVNDFFNKRWKAEDLYLFIDQVKSVFVKKHPSVEYIKNELFYVHFLKIIRWVMVFENRIGFDTFDDVNLKTVKLRMLYTMRKVGKPIRYNDLPKHILSYFPDRKVRINTIHNELVKNNDIFVNTWLGIYGLTERWYKWWTVLVIVFRVMKNIWRPMYIKEITKEVLKEKMVSPSTITLSLQKYKNIFERTEKWVYKIADEAKDFTEDYVKSLK